jgi:hypothetical protein
MLDTEEFINWLESRRLITAKLSSLDASIIALDGKVDRYNEVARERTAEMFNDCQRAITDFQTSAAVHQLQDRLWSAFIGLLTGGLATAIVELLLHQPAR